MINILITSAGTASAISVIKALKAQTALEVRLIATDMDEMAAGLYLADAYYLTPSIKEAAYLPTLLEIIQKEQIQLMFPIFSKEIEVIAQHKEILDGVGVKLLLHPIESIQLVNDKFRMGDWVAAQGIDTPRCFPKKELSLLTENHLPIFVKPVSSSSSKGARKLTKLEEIKQLLPQYDSLVFQEYVEGTEYTLDILVNKAHQPIVIAPRIRLSTKAGQSVKGETVSSEPFVEMVETICKGLKLVGPCNIQFMKQGDRYYFIEVNPRFAAGGLMLTVGAGANIPLLAVKEMLGMPIDEAVCKTRPGVRMTRYWEEIILG